MIPSQGGQIEGENAVPAPAFSGLLAILCVAVVPAGADHAVPRVPLVLAKPATTAARLSITAQDPVVVRLQSELSAARRELENLRLLQAAPRLAAKSLSKVWDNPDDAAYNEL